jgi:hypothetical protein
MGSNRSKSIVVWTSIIPMSTMWRQANIKKNNDLSGCKNKRKFSSCHETLSFLMRTTFHGMGEFIAIHLHLTSVHKSYCAKSYKTKRIPSDLRKVVKVNQHN